MYTYMLRKGLNTTEVCVATWSVIVTELGHVDPLIFLATELKREMLSIKGRKYIFLKSYIFSSGIEFKKDFVM